MRIRVQLKEGIFEDKRVIVLTGMQRLDGRPLTTLKDIIEAITVSNGVFINEDEWIPIGSIERIGVIKE